MHQTLLMSTDLISQPCTNHDEKHTILRNCQYHLALRVNEYLIILSIAAPANRALCDAVQG
jgi:hypothetical protein